MNILDEIRQVIDIEIEALRSVRDALGEPFVQAVETIAACRGQIFVTGVGKSGIIAQKIAATLRSTGTGAVFLHAADGLHGDIGMIDGADVVIAVGKSGESAELNAFLRESRKAGTRIIAITSAEGSSMAALSDLVLTLPVPREACPLNLAPTASTTAALAVGDGIAVALMKLKNISEEDFARHHPGGQLGRRLLLKVGDLMHAGADNPVIAIDRPVREMLVQVTAFRVGAISIVDRDGVLVGLVTDYDIRKALEGGGDILKAAISEIMNPSPETVFDDMKAVDALEIMRGRTKPTAVVPVIDRNRVAVGMLHVHDLVAAGL